MLLPGFVSKMNLLNAAAAFGGKYAFTGVIALLLSALLTAAYLLPMSLRAFLPGKGIAVCYTEKDRDPGLCMAIPFVVLCMVMVFCGVCAGPFMNRLQSLIMGGV